MFGNIEIQFSYIREATSKKVSFSNQYSNEDFEAICKIDKNKNIENFTLVINPKAQLVIDELIIRMPYKFKESHRIFMNGYQSWTDSKEFFIDDKIRTISSLAKPVIKKYQFHKYGDYTFKKYSRKKGELHGYTYTYIREGENLDLLGSLSEKSGFTIFEVNTKENKVIINKECKGLSINSAYIPFKLFYENGKEKEVFDSYFQAMNIPKPRFKPATGWTSWYNYYQDINQEVILENLNNFKAFNKEIEFFQIDDGYQTAVGDWLSIDAKKFPKGMKYIAETIKKNGHKAGIWLAPFVCEKNSEIFKSKQHWLLRDEKGEAVLAGSNWSSFYALDIYNSEVREYLQRVFSVMLDQWGYDMVKLDFLYAVCLVPRKDKTRGQIMTEAMEFLREIVGDKIILGCGVPLGPAFGLVDYCRIGCDVSLDWDDKFYMRKLHRERVSTLNSIGNAIGRRHLDGRAFLNDPDVFLLREENIYLNETQKETLAMVNNIFGSLLFTSDNLKNYKARQFDVYDKAMDLKDIKIESVENYKNGIVEIIYIEEKNKYLLLINLKDSTVSYSSDLLKDKVQLSAYSSKVEEI
uniref:Alpha-galactosidase n=1 Tax=Clostridium cellulovorans TaxID=1493 RepID=A0A173MZW0_CLOCL|nr:alpha-galactosidase [Clostridium cellulovorans]